MFFSVTGMTNKNKLTASPTERVSLDGALDSSELESFAYQIACGMVSGDNQKLTFKSSSVRLNPNHDPLRASVYVLGIQLCNTIDNVFTIQTNVISIGKQLFSLYFCSFSSTIIIKVPFSYRTLNTELERSIMYHSNRPMGMDFKRTFDQIRISKK